MTHQGHDQSTRGSRRRLVGAAGLVIFMAQLDATIVAIALPRIEVDLGTTTTVAEWVALGYVVPLVALTLPAGRWLDQAARGPALVLGALGFASASAAAGLSQSIGALVASRVAQGGFAALLLALAPVIAVEAVRSEARGRALSVVSTVAPLGAVAGPILGGQLVNAAGWQSIFFVNLPIAAAVAVVARRDLPRGPRLSPPDRGSTGEAALVGGAAVALLLALSLAPSHGPGWLLLLAVVPALLGAWRRTGASRSARRLLRAPGMAAPHVALAASYAALLLTQFLAPFYLGRTLGVSTATAGFTLLAYPAATALIGPVSGWLTDWSGTVPVAIVGALVLTAGLALAAPLSGEWQPLDLAWRLAVVGVGFGLFVTPVQSDALSRAPRELLATTSASTNLARQVGMAIGPALGTAVWAACGYRLSGMRLATVVAVALSAVAAVSVARPWTREPASAALRTSPESTRTVLDTK